MYKMQSGISHLLLDDVSGIFGHLCEAHVGELEACLHARWGREECALNWYHTSSTITHVWITVTDTETHV